VVKKVKGTFSFKVKNASGKETGWFVDCKTGSGSVQQAADSEYALY